MILAFLFTIFCIGVAIFHHQVTDGNPGFGRGFLNGVLWAWLIIRAPEWETELYNWSKKHDKRKTKD